MANLRRVGSICAALATVAGLTAGATVSSPVGAQGAKPIVYLTFDDGPSSDSASAGLLDVLAQYDVPATFFIVGTNVAGGQDVLRRMYADGHAVGSHSWSHPELNSLTDTQLVQGQLQATHDAVKAATGQDIQCFRSPWGTSFTGPREVGLIQGFGYDIHNTWQIDATEYTVGVTSLPGNAATATAMAQRLAGARNGDVILMHDGFFGRQAMVSAVSQFLAAHRNDYEFRLLPGCGGSYTQGGSIPPAAAIRRGPVANATTIDEIRAATDYQATADANVLRLYHAFLAREPEAAGAVYWIGQSRRGLSLDDTAWNFSTSPEFFQKYGNLDNGSFVAVVYQNVLGRTPDPAGLAYWIGTVNSGQLSRHGVVRWIAASAEFIGAHPYSAQ